MGLRLDQILTLTGTLDDVPGFDTARERFRRFLLEHVPGTEGIRTLIEQAQHVPGEQHFRALQDLVGALGRSFGFDVTLASAAPVDAPVRTYTCWRSPRRVLLVAVPAPRAPWPAPRDLARAAAAVREAEHPALRIDALIVTAPFALAHAGGEGTLSAPVEIPADGPMPRVATIGLQPLLSLAELVSSGGVTHGDVVQLFEAGTAIDGIVGVLARTAAQGPAAPPAPDAAIPVAEPGRPRSGCWISSVTPEHAMTPEEFLDVVVSKRHVFGIAEEGAQPGSVRAGDGLCFYLRGKGVVGHARVTSTLESGGGLRDARRFRQVLRLDHIHLHLESPTPLDPETALRLRRAPVGAGRHAQVLVEISRESYRELTTEPPVTASSTVVPFAPGERGSETTDESVDPSAGDGREHDRNIL